MLPLCKDAQHGGSAAAAGTDAHTGNSHLQTNHRAFRKMQPPSSDTIRPLGSPLGHPMGKGTWDRAAGRAAVPNPSIAPLGMAVGGHGASHGARSILQRAEPRRRSNTQPCSPSLTLVAHIWPGDPAGSHQAQGGGCPMQHSSGSQPTITRLLACSLPHP